MDVSVSTYLTQYPQEVAFGEEDPGAVFDRYHTADFVMWNDGIELDREGCSLTSDRSASAPWESTSRCTRR
jgi:hypothetical protein